MFETYLVRNGQEHPVQFLNQLFEGWSLGGNSMPAFTHHHIAAGKKYKDCLKIHIIYHYVTTAFFRKDVDKNVLC